MREKGNAIVYCEGAFNTPEGKTAHGLVRFTERYRVVAVIDSRYAGQDAGKVLDDRPNHIPIVGSFQEVLDNPVAQQFSPTHFVIGLAPDGGRLPKEALEVVECAIHSSLHIVSGLHDFLSDKEELSTLAQKKGITIKDIRKTPSRDQLHFFSGKIDEVNALVIALLGTDSAVGKRTTAWVLVHALRKKGIKAELIGTGQTAWLQGAVYSFVLDSLINDFISGEIEHAVHSAWKDGAEVIIIEGQGSLLNPAYPGGFEILAAGRPDMVVLQHAPTRTTYDGFPDFPMHPLSKQIQAIEFISDKPVVAVTINHEEMERSDLPTYKEKIYKEVGLRAYDVLWEEADELVELVLQKRR